MRKLAFLVALTTAGALLGIAPAAAQPSPDVTTFCDAALNVDETLTPLFEGKKPSTRAKQQIDSALTEAESTAPPEIAPNVQSAAGTFRNFLQSGKESALETPTLEQDSKTIDQYRYNSCGYQQVAVTGIEYEFQGMPKTLPAGKVAFQFTDTGAELHEMEIFRIKGTDSLRKILGLSEKDASKKTEMVASGFATQNETSYVIADMSTPGRYGVACHLPVGSTSEREAERKSGGEHGGGATPHWKKGMRSEITVT
jgi:hypothetical protein